MDRRSFLRGLAATPLALSLPARASEPMAKIEEYCEVRTTSGIYKDWVSVAVSYSADDHENLRRFRLQAAEPSRKTFLLKPGDRVDIALAGHIVIENGYITDRQSAYDANRHAVQLDGASVAVHARRVSVNVPGGEFRNYDISSIANRVLEPHGIKFRLLGSPEGASLKFPVAAVRHGESPMSFITRLAKQRNLRLQNAANGDILAGTPEGSGSGAAFEEGSNILSASCHIEMPSAKVLYTNAQRQGSDSLFGKPVAEIQAKATVENGLNGLVSKILAEMPLSSRETQLRTDMAVADLQSMLLKVSLVYQGWLKPGGGLWGKLGEDVSVKSPMLFPTFDGQQTLKLWGVTYTQDAQAGTTTGLQLVSPNAWGQRYGTGDQFGSQPTTPAQPESPT